MRRRGTTSSGRVRVRRLVDESEVGRVAVLAAQAFGENSVDARVVRAEVNVALRRALWGKRMSAAKVRQRRGEEEAGGAEGLGAMEREREARVRANEMERLARARQWMCLLADVEGEEEAERGEEEAERCEEEAERCEEEAERGEEEAGGPRACVGAATVALVRCEAALPPPFPTGAAWRPYLCNMAVDVECRRRGLATQLLASAERLARRWGHADLWLHSEVDNHAALALYQGAGYEVVARDPVWRSFLTGDRQRLLLRKAFAAPAAGGGGGGDGGGDGDDDNAA